MKKTKIKTTSTPTVADLKQRLAALDAQIAERQRQSIEAEQAEAHAIAQQEAAQGVKTRVRFAAMVDEDPEAQAQLATATDADVRARLGVEDWRAVKLELASKLRELADERVAIVQDIARAENAVDTEAACAVLSEIDAAVVTMISAWARFRDIRIRQVQRAVDADLPEGEVKRYHHLRPLERVFRWLFADLGIGDRPESHWGRNMSLVGMEREICGGGPSTDADAPEPTITDADEQTGVNVH